MRNLLTATLAILVIVGFVPSILANDLDDPARRLGFNQPIAGSGCTDPRSYAELGRVPDELTGRKMVEIGVDHSTPMLELLEKNNTSPRPKNSSRLEAGTMRMRISAMFCLSDIVWTLTTSRMRT